MVRLVATVLLSAFFVIGHTVNVDAQRRNRRARRVQNSELAKSLGEIRWGWTKRQLLAHFRREIKRDFEKRIANAPGAIEEDEVRQQLRAKLSRLEDGYVEFRGRTTGHDSGFLRDEFTHNNGEALLRVRGDGSDDYYFFINDRLWKWYRAFDAAVFQGADFNQFRQALEGRYGRGKIQTGKLLKRADERRWIEWQDRKTRARAMDNTTFYGFYCLVFEERKTLSKLSSLREREPGPRNRKHALVEAVTSGDPASTHDANADIVDRVTGRIRNRQQAPKE